MSPLVRSPAGTKTTLSEIAVWPALLTRKKMQRAPPLRLRDRRSLIGLEAELAIKTRDRQNRAESLVQVFGRDRHSNAIRAHCIEDA